ncbi:MAG: twin-arginine translocation signal domain-containing protein [Ignavibacteriales bacterium]|nr:twin-arginine translocation signal domain-containing protein [Ignavibacteriales bacterium]
MFVPGTVEALAGGPLREPADVVIVDPPRVGLTGQGAQADRPRRRARSRLRLLQSGLARPRSPVAPRRGIPDLVPRPVRPLPPHAASRNAGRARPLSPLLSSRSIVKPRPRREKAMTDPKSAPSFGTPPRCCPCGQDQAPPESSLSRRDFLKGAGVTALGSVAAGGLAWPLLGGPRHAGR